MSDPRRLASIPRMSTATTVLATAAAVAAGVYGLNVNSRRAARADRKAFGSSVVPPANLTSLRLHSAEMVNYNTKRLRFEFSDKESTSGLGASQATLAVTFPGGGWTPLPRPYTPVSDPNQKGFIDYLVKLYPNGKGSTAMHNLQPGQSLKLMPIPVGYYTHNPSTTTHVAMVAGGAGITPMYSLAQSILSDPADKRTRITLVWGVNEDRDLFLEKEFASMSREHPGRFRAVYAVSRPEKGSRNLSGYVTGEVLKEAGVEKVEGVKVLVCGPPGFEGAMMKGSDGGVLGALGFGRRDIHKF